MNPGEFNTALAQLSVSLNESDEPHLRLTAVCAFLHETRESFQPREQWSQKAKLILQGHWAATIQSLFTTERLLNFTQDQLVHLHDIFGELGLTGADVTGIADKVTVARVMQWLYVGDTSRAGELLGQTMRPYVARQLVKRAQDFINDSLQHPLAPHLQHLLLAWKLQSGKRTSANSVSILLVAPRQTGWAEHGILSKLSYVTHDAKQDGVSAIPPDVSVVAARSWLKGRSFESVIEGGRFACEDVASELTGQSHTLAVAALIAINSGGIANSWERVGYLKSLAMTGEVDTEGWLKQVEGLQAKLTRAFFSPLQCVAIPAMQTRDAQIIVDHLQEMHPLRKLRLLPTWSLSNVLERPVTGLQRSIDPLKWVLYRGSRASRAIAFTASVLLLIGGINLLLIAFPKLNPWFDWQPVYWDVRDGQHVELLNRNEQVISRVKLAQNWKPGPAAEPSFSNRMAGEQFVRAAYNKEVNTKPEGSARYLCHLADINGDGQKEVFFRCTLDAVSDTTSIRVCIYCLSLKSEFPWFRNLYEVLWDRIFIQEDLFPLTGVHAEYPIFIRSMYPVDWQGDGRANLVLSIHDNKKVQNGSAYLEELDGRTGETIGRFWHSQWFFGLSAITELNSTRQTLWAGTFGKENATPELFIFHDSLRSRLWPCEDTTGMRAIRFPNSDVALAYNVPTNVNLIQQPGSNSSEIRITIRSTQHHVDEQTDWRGYTFLVNHEAHWLGDSFDLSYAQHLNKFEKDGYIKLPADLNEWLPPLTYSELWTGKTWIPLDTTRPRPVPYPIFELSDPRLQKDIKLPVRWQDL